jgi:hypothetical protein
MKWIMTVLKRIFQAKTYRPIDANHVFVGMDDSGIIGIIVEGQEGEYELRLEAMQAAAVAGKIDELLTLL